MRRNNKLRPSLRVVRGFRLAVKPTAYTARVPTGVALACGVAELRRRFLAAGGEPLYVADEVYLAVGSGYQRVQSRPLLEALGAEKLPGIGWYQWDPQQESA